MPVDSPLNGNLSNEKIISLRESDNPVWELYFDGVISFQWVKTQKSTIHKKVGIGLIFITPKKGMMYFSYNLSEHCINNEAEYETVTTCMKLANQLEVKDIKMFCNSSTNKN